MFRNHIKIAFRNLWKNKGYSIINIVGLSIGLAVCLLIFLFIRYETNFDAFHANKNRIYRIVSSWQYGDGMEYSEGTPLPLPRAVEADFPEFEKVAAVARAGYQITVPGTGNKTAEKFDESGKMFYVQPEFYEMFDFPWLVGEPATALKAPNSVVLTQSYAKKYFGDWHKALGQTLILNNKKTLKVTGILKDIPESTNFPFYIAISYSTFSRANSENTAANWGSVSTAWQTFVMLKPNAAIAQAEMKLPAFIRKYIKDNNIANGKAGYVFQPLDDIHFSEKYGAYGHQANITELTALGIIGIFILLIACINFINMATAQATNRSKEVGIRKVLGSKRLSLIVQFMGETVLITLSAILLACIIAELLLPWMRKLIDLQLTFNVLRYPVILLFILIVVVFTSLLAGLYPALILSGFDPAHALKGKKSIMTSGGIRIRKILIVVQFTITLVLITGTLIIMEQMKFFRNKPMGFDRSAVALIDLPADSINITKFGAFKNALSTAPGIIDMSFCYTPPSSSDYSLNNVVSFDHKKISPSFQVITNYADTGFFSTFGLQWVAGHSFMPGDTVRQLVVNETLLKKLGVKDPQDAIGKTMSVHGKETPIIGVVKDFVNRSLIDKTDPIVIATRKNIYRELAIKLRPSDIEKTMKSVAFQYDKIFPGYLYKAHFYDQDIADYYISEARMAKLFKVFAFIVLLISTIGLLSLLSFITVQRTKEIAVRKVLGASVTSILQLLGSKFILLVLIAGFIACPVVYLLARQWLNGFAYRINMPVMPFVISIVSAITLTVVVVIIQTWKAAKANPAGALKYE